MPSSRSTLKAISPARNLMEEDALLWHRLRRGDLAALDELARRFESPLHRYLESLMHSEADREDVVQEALLRIFERASDSHEPRSLRAWVFRCARNEALMRMRSASRRRWREKLFGRFRASPAEPPARRAGRVELGDALQRALSELPETQRSAFLLREREGQSYAEIAEVLGCREKTVSSRISRARESLRHALADWQEELA